MTLSSSCDMMPKGTSTPTGPMPSRQLPCMPVHMNSMSPRHYYCGHESPISNRSFATARYSIAPTPPAHYGYDSDIYRMASINVIRTYK